jgi:tungstate transport system ATP-binding protein
MTGSSAPLLSVTGLRKSWGAQLLLDIPHLKLDAATAYVLTGANGVGKSSLLRILSGLEPAHAEQVCFMGQASSLSPYPVAMREAIVYVHQHPVMFSTTVMDNIAFGLRARGLKNQEVMQRAEEALQWAGVAHLRERDPAVLSGGEKQRIALARARVLRPRLLLLDEPTANLDGAAREQVIELIPTLLQSGASIVMACHDRDLINLPGVHRLKLRDTRLEAR